MAKGERVIKLPTRQELKRVRGNIGTAYPFLERSCFDVYHVKYDFDGDMIPGDATAPGKFQINSDSSGTFTIRSDQLNGVARLSSVGSTANQYTNLTLPNLNMQCKLNCVMAVRLSLPSIADIKVEVGFTDDATDTGVVNDLGATNPTFTAADFAVWICDTNDTGNATWQGVSAIAGTISTTGKIEPTGLNATYPSAGVFQTLVVALCGDVDTQSAKYFILDGNGYLAYESVWTDAAITHGTQLCPVIGLTLRTTTIKYVDVDFIEIWQRRTLT